ncbi:ISNCY family transposase [Acidisoma silvae]|uniref:DDE-type integrase/transposase/recombinase n=1 Tax=Acidisoma silvae TaxID=2802396 RepID=A0A963YX98_9PROT|nr:ISNCY family transposase [Acidisoma silvae]MCB8878544.1 DDE-type integrase/transposase/recombinase [Acidisoma silvae]
MRQVNMATRNEIVSTLRKRYQTADRTERGRILDEFVAVAGFHRKHAMRLLSEAGDKPSRQRADGRLYDDETREALIMVWEASDRICSRRLKVLIPILLEAMERHGHPLPTGDVCTKLVAMSAATIDRALNRAKARPRGRRRKASVPSVRLSIPVRTFEDWDDPAPGFMEMDLVAHSGGMLKGSYVQTLVLTDIATGWTECAPLLVREQNLLTKVLDEVRSRLPFPLLGIDVDNDSVFMNETVKDYCTRHSIELTRCRPYRKNDQAWVEQKNGAVVRRAIGYRRYEGLEAARLLAKFYAALRLYVNFYQPSFKLLSKARDGGRIIKRYHTPATPQQRVHDDRRVTESAKAGLLKERVSLDPIELLRSIRQLQEELVNLSDGIVPGSHGAPNAVTLEKFLAGLKTAWESGPVVRPTHRRKAMDLLQKSGELFWVRPRAFRRQRG